MYPNDPLKRVLYVDLTRRRSWVEERPELFEEGLGGAGAAILLLEEECPAGTDPLGPDNPIILAVGPLTGYYPMGSKTVAMFKSPHTGNLGESHAGGRSAISIRMAGYGAIVIRGASETPVYLVVKDDKAHFRDASAMWGIRDAFNDDSSVDTVDSVLRKREGDSGLRTILRIGPAGERQVTYASVSAETYRHFGRLGLGAVFGSKKLKAMVISGKYALPIHDRKAYRESYETIFKAATQSPLMKKYHELGTAMNIEPLNLLGGLPTRNLQAGEFEEAEDISGEHLAADYLGRRVACAHCPVACVHLAALRIPYPNDPYFFKTVMIGYDYELIYAVGSLLGVGDPEGMLQIIDEIETLGMDMMSAGVALAWATEAFENGLIDEEDTDGIELKFGNAKGYVNAARRIVLQPTEFYKALARGVDYASAKYGGEEYALAFGGNEMPGYHTGPAAHLNYLSGARHSHLDSGGYGVDQKALKAGKPLSPEEIADKLVTEERWRQVLSSLAVCFFARGVYDPGTVIDALTSVGYSWTGGRLTRMSEETLRRKYAFKEREGFELSEVRIPSRIYETEVPGDVEFDEEFMRRALERYRELL